jgi:putative FmdB family regulatory protein
MPFYDLDCPACGELIDVFMRIAETDSPRCPKCLGPSRIILRPVHLDIFKPQWFENIDSSPQYVESKKQLREICDKNGLTCWKSVDGERGSDVKEV